MCFNKSKSSSAQTTKSATTQRDERLAATERSNIVSAKDGGSAALSVYNYDLSADVAEDAIRYNYYAVTDALDHNEVALSKALSHSTNAMEDAFGFSGQVTDRALNAVIEGGEDALRFAGDVFNSAIGAVHEGNERANAFVSSTQAQFADARETDTKQLLEQLVKIVAIGTAGLVAYQVMK